MFTPFSLTGIRIYDWKMMLKASDYFRLKGQK